MLYSSSTGKDGLPQPLLPSDQKLTEISGIVVFFLTWLRFICGPLNILLAEGQDQCPSTLC